MRYQSECIIFVRSARNGMAQDAVDSCLHNPPCRTALFCDERTTVPSVSGGFDEFSLRHRFVESVWLQNECDPCLTRVPKTCSEETGLGKSRELAAADFECLVILKCRRPPSEAAIQPSNPFIRRVRLQLLPSGND